MFLNNFCGSEIGLVSDKAVQCRVEEFIFSWPAFATAKSHVYTTEQLQAQCSEAAVLQQLLELQKSTEFPSI